MTLSLDGARWLFEVTEGNRALTMTRTQLKEGFDWSDVLREERQPLIDAIEARLSTIAHGPESPEVTEVRALVAALLASGS